MFLSISRLRSCSRAEGEPEANGNLQRCLYARQRRAAPGVDRLRDYDTMRAISDETPAHRDAQLGRLIERLKDRGEWEYTLLVVAADYSVRALAGQDFIVGVHDSLPAWHHLELGACCKCRRGRAPAIEPASGVPAVYGVDSPRHSR